MSMDVISFKKKASSPRRSWARSRWTCPRIPHCGLLVRYAAEARIAQEGLDFAGGIHGAEHAAIGMLPLFAMCDRNDIGGLSTPSHPDTGKAQIFIYDAYPGGVGIAEKGFELIRELWQATLAAITECPCQDGCPAASSRPSAATTTSRWTSGRAQCLLEGLLECAGAGVTAVTAGFGLIMYNHML